MLSDLAIGGGWRITFGDINGWFQPPVMQANSYSNTWKRKKGGEIQVAPTLNGRIQRFEEADVEGW